MSMTQEEIEALMSDSNTAGEASSDEFDIDNLDDVLDGISEEKDDNEIENLDDILDGISEEKDDNEIENLDDILDGIDGIESESEEPMEDFNDILDEIPEEETNKNIENFDDILNEIDNDDIEENDTANENLNAEVPLPLSNEHKVVDQLHEVAEDNEAKACQILDILSDILDENAKSSKIIINNSEFINSQIELLSKLVEKFPNIKILNENLEKANLEKLKNEDVIINLEGQSNKIFEAIELMQYQDINRQKIERVMSVIKKLTTYLNGIFEDSSGKAEVQIAKQISGDSSESINDEDLDSLISEFSK